MGTFRIGIDLGGTKIEGALVSPEGAIVARTRLATPREDYDATIAAVTRIVSALAGDAATRTNGGSEAAPSVGVGHPGAISPATGRIKNANSTWLNGRHLKQDLESALGRAVACANDADCFALSEAIDGSARGAPVVFGVILGTGVGGGIVVGGRLVAGPNAIAGEWGHNALPWPEDDERPGPACYCGRGGCIETWLSGPGLARSWHAAGGDEATAHEIVARAGAGEPLAVRTLERYEHRLARALAGVINLLDPHAIVLGGGLSNIARLYANVPKLWSGWVFSDRVDTRLLAPAHGDASGVRGAAWLGSKPR